MLQGLILAKLIVQCVTMPIMSKNKQVLDPAFLRKSDYSYVDCTDDNLSSVLCYALAKNKSDLILHQQRIEHYSKMKSKELVFSAIVDLFMALGDKGNDYKKRMLNKYQSLLSVEHNALLKQYLTGILKDSTVISDIKESMLSLGLKGKILSNKDC